MELREAREKYFDDIEEGQTICPCCDRVGQIYAITINVSMARSLIWLCRASELSPDRWVDVPRTAPKELTRTNQLSSLKHWNLIQRKTNENTKTKTSGIWRPTEYGKRFVLGHYSISKKVFVYNDSPVKYVGELVKIHNIVDHFDYSKTITQTLKET